MNELFFYSVTDKNDWEINYWDKDQSIHPDRMKKKDAIIGSDIS